MRKSDCYDVPCTVNGHNSRLTSFFLSYNLQFHNWKLQFFVVAFPTFIFEDKLTDFTRLIAYEGRVPSDYDCSRCFLHLDPGPLAEVEKLIASLLSLSRLIEGPICKHETIAAYETEFIRSCSYHERV